MKMKNTQVRVKKLSDKAVIPRRAHETDTGYDLTVLDIDKIEGDVIFFKTGLAVQPPAGYYFEIFPRSSISKMPISLANSVAIIDETYTGEVLVAVRVHHSDMGHDTRRTSYPNGIVEFAGGKPPSMYELAKLILAKKPVFSQLVLRKRLDCDFVDGELQETERGSGGFGSTDKV